MTRPGIRPNARAAARRGVAVAILVAVALAPAAAPARGRDLCRLPSDCPEGRFCQGGMCQRSPGLGDGSPLFGLGLPGLLAPRGGPDVETARRATELLRRTVRMLGAFRVMDARTQGDLGTVEAPTRTGFDAQGWHESGAYALLFGALWSTAAGGVVLEVRLFETETGRSVMLGAERQRIPMTGLRGAVRNVAGALLAHYTGRDGLAATRIAFTRKLPGGVKEVFTVDVTGEDEQQVTRNGSVNIFPAWSPRGDIAYTSYRAGNPDLWVGERRLSSRPDLNSGAAYSPDGRHVALTLAQDGDPELYLIDARSGAIVRRLTHHSAIDTSPTFSPDGRHIAFVSDRIGAPQIYIMRADGSDLRAMTSAGYNTNPCWSPAGDTIAFDRLITAERADIYRLDPVSGEIRRLTSNRWSSEDPSFSPDGRRIVFTSTHDGERQLYVMSTNGGPAIRLTHGDGPYGSPAWSPIAPDAVE